MREAHAINLSWLLRLRWGAVVGQGGLVLFARMGMGMPLPLVPLAAACFGAHIQRVLADCGGNISEAARRLGLHRRSLQRKLQKYPPAQ